MYCLGDEIVKYLSTIGLVIRISFIRITESLYDLCPWGAEEEGGHDNSMFWIAMIYAYCPDVILIVFLLLPKVSWFGW